MGAQRVFGLLLSIACIYSANAQSYLCPSITINDLGSTTNFSDQGLVSRALSLNTGEAGANVPARIMNFATVCDASGVRIGTSSYVSVVVEFHCDFPSSTSGSLTVCSDPSTLVTRQYQFQCIEDNNGQPVWGAIVAGSNLFVQTLNPIARLSTPLADECRRCIDDQQSPANTNIDGTTHCDLCSDECVNQGQGRCYLGPVGEVCCSFYQQGNCTTECLSPLVVDSNFHCVCPALTLTNGAVSYSMPNGVERDIGSVATHTCNSGYRLEVNNARAVGNTRTCSEDGWDGRNFTCVKIMCPDLSIPNGVVTISPAEQGYLSRTTYECNPGFALKGDGNRVCQMDSTWNGTDPECELLCGGCDNGICDEATGKCKCEPGFVGDHCSSDCSIALQDPNCAECGFDDRGMPICTKCKEGSGYTVKDGKCEKEGETSASTSSCSTGCIIGIILAILGAIILSIVVVLVVYAVYRYLSNPATKLAKAGTEGLNGVARDNPLYLPPEEIVGDVGDVETA